MYNRNKIVPLVLALAIGIGITTNQLAYATNESSYNYGFKQGFSDYNTPVVNIDADDPTPNIDVQACDNSVLGGSALTNSTACIDGYIDGWQHWCKMDFGINYGPKGLYKLKS
jgi:hypothetical protein